MSGYHSNSGSSSSNSSSSSSKVLTALLTTKSVALPILTAGVLFMTRQLTSLIYVLFRGIQRLRTSPPPQTTECLTMDKLSSYAYMIDFAYRGKTSNTIKCCTSSTRGKLWLFASNELLPFLTSVCTGVGVICTVLFRACMLLFTLLQSLFGALIAPFFTSLLPVIALIIHTHLKENLVLYKLVSTHLTDSDGIRICHQVLLCVWNMRKRGVEYVVLLVLLGAACVVVAVYAFPYVMLLLTLEAKFLPFFLSFCMVPGTCAMTLIGAVGFVLSKLLNVPGHSGDVDLTAAITKEQGRVLLSAIFEKTRGFVDNMLIKAVDKTRCARRNFAPK